MREKILFLTITIVILAGCNSATNAETTQVSPSATPTLMPAYTITVVTSTLTPVDTITPSPSPTPTNIPTLPAEDARKKLLDLLANNGDCQLPCLWGITPGKSTNQEAQSVLSSLSGISNIFEIEPKFDLTRGFVLPSFAEGENDLLFNTRVSYLADNQIVSQISFYAREEQIPTDSNGNWVSRRPIYGLSRFIKRVEYYSLSNLLSKQGIPTSVMIASSGPGKNRRGAILTHIGVFYPDQGIWAQYTTLVNAKEVGSSIISCPVNAHIEMGLYPPGNPNSFYMLLEQTDWGITKNSYKPLEEATSMTVEQFYEIFRNPTDICIETPTNIWPTPEMEGVN